MYEEAFRHHVSSNGGPTWGQTTTEILNELGADVVLEGPQPILTQYQVINVGPVVEQNGQWYTSYVVTDVDDQTKTQIDVDRAKSVRIERDLKLTACDWTQTLDSPINNKSAWATYRQELREITKQSGFPWTITWPTDPNGNQ
jgi:hypothetical protein